MSSDLVTALYGEYAVPHEPLFTQAATEVLATLTTDPAMTDGGTVARIKRLLVPERIITFKVLWTNDRGELEVNTGYRVQFNSALGPYKGGLRFDPSVTLDTLKFLGFEQIFKNALTGLPLGGGKGGSDFNPKGRSENEIRNFCRAFMTQLYPFVGIELDVPAGDIGVAGREIGYLMGMYKELTHRSEGVLTGKPVAIGGSLGRTEATGHGVVYFARAVLRRGGETLVGKTAVVSGSGNVAEHTARQLIAEGAVVLTLSDRTGYVHKPAGLTLADIDALMTHKETGNLDTFHLAGTTFTAGTPWQTVPADLYFPCATQNEVTVADATIMAKTAKAVVEGANMPLTNEAIAVLHTARIPHAPGKASNAGGVAVSGLEMVQNASHYPWTREEVEEKLVAIMEQIHDTCVAEGTIDGYVNYVHGANIAGAKRVLSAMAALGW